MQIIKEINKDGTFTLSTIYNNQRYKMRYGEYTYKEAKKKFKAFVLEEEEKLFHNKTR